MGLLTDRSDDRRLQDGMPNKRHGEIRDRTKARFMSRGPHLALEFGIFRRIDTSAQTGQPCQTRVLDIGVRHQFVAIAEGVVGGRKLPNSNY